MLKVVIITVPTILEVEIYRLSTKLLENLTDDTIDSLYVTKYSTVSFYLTKLYVTETIAI